MGILLWIIFGALAGWIATVIMKTDRHQNTGYDIVLGIIGSVVGGLLMGTIGQSGVTGFNIQSLIVAVIGSIVVIFIGRKLKNR
ncbi:MAG: GlsB/YeaQ/YmgE family stress response membrane protein [Candidatus Shapirobacteria bacterium]|jgi:uncharacterized membrane protein YeaQ/YmgE (transglycosylase-associated protein family)